MRSGGWPLPQPAGRRKTPQRTPQARFEASPRPLSAPCCSNAAPVAVPPTGPLDSMSRRSLAPILASGSGHEATSQNCIADVVYHAVFFAFGVLGQVARRWRLKSAKVTCCRERI
jgi:hypothetical protein